MTTTTTTTATFTSALHTLRAALNTHPGKPRKYHPTWPAWSEAFSLLRTLERTEAEGDYNKADERLYVSRINDELQALKYAKDPNSIPSSRSMQQITGNEPASTYNPANPWACLND